jgi:uncharacterized protein
MGLELSIIKINKPEDLNVIIGQAHFIKTVEDIYEVLISSMPGVKFAVAFCEASGARLLRVEGNDENLKKIAVENTLNVGAGHSFFIAMDKAFPINVLNQIKMVPEVCRIYCATANPLEVIVAQTAAGRGILGVIDGMTPVGVEDQEGVTWRKDLLRKIGYKL